MTIRYMDQTKITHDERQKGVMSDNSSLVNVPTHSCWTICGDSKQVFYYTEASRKPSDNPTGRKWKMQEYTTYKDEDKQYGDPFWAATPSLESAHGAGQRLEVIVGRHWHVQGTSAKEGVGLNEGFNWLTNTLVEIAKSKAAEEAAEAAGKEESMSYVATGFMDPWMKYNGIYDMTDEVCSGQPVWSNGVAKAMWTSNDASSFDGDDEATADRWHLVDQDCTNPKTGAGAFGRSPPKGGKGVLHDLTRIACEVQRGWRVYMKDDVDKWPTSKTAYFSITYKSEAAKTIHEVIKNPSDYDIICSGAPNGI